MKIFVSIAAFLIIIMAGVPGYTQQDDQVINQVNSAMKAADSKKIASYFHSTIDLEVGETDGNFSNKQAEIILKDFLDKNPVKSYTIKHKGSSDDGSKYIIGAYTSSNNTVYRVYILLKRADAKLKINQLQFEED